MGIPNLGRGEAHQLHCILVFVCLRIASIQNRFIQEKPSTVTEFFVFIGSS